MTRILNENSKQRDGSEKKQAILEAATHFFAQRGFRDTAINEIARVVGVADGTVFYHYRTKEELFIAVLENFKELVIRESQDYLAKQRFDNGLAMVEGLLSFYLEMAAAMEERFLLLHRHYPYQLAEQNPACRGHLEGIYEFFGTLFEQAIIRGQEDGSIRELSARKTGLLLFTLVDGLVRLETYRLYKTGTLYHELMAGARSMLQNFPGPDTPDQP